MTLTAPDAAVEADSVRRTRRRTVVAWIVIGVVLVLAGGIGAALTSANQWSQRGLLDPDSAGPAGSRALAQILREQGIDVEVVRSRDDAKSTVGAQDTLVLPSTAVLSDGAVQELADRAGRVVLVDPSSRDIRLLFSGEGSAGYAPDAPVSPDCALPEAERAGAIVPGTLFAADGEVVGCYRVDGDPALVATDDAVAIDARELFTNARLTADGNAALGLGLLGALERVVWYMPSPQDSDLTTGVPTLGDLTPPWVTPAILLLLSAGVVAAVWRGRRFGPLVAENLPVTVRASETMEGRARLYARSRDAAHALDALRLGALERIARQVGLGPAAQAPEVADAAADRIGAQRDLVRGILIDSIPSTDADLVAASDRLRDLEAAVRASLRPERIDP